MALLFSLEHRGSKVEWCILVIKLCSKHIVIGFTTDVLGSNFRVKIIYKCSGEQ